MIRKMLGPAVFLVVFGVVLLSLPVLASAAEPVPFATASAPCSSSKVVFPVQSVAHPDAIYRFRSVGAEGGGFAPGDIGWSYYRGGVEAGTAPELSINCTSGSVEASLADRPTTPATFSGVTTPGDGGSELPLRPAGHGQYVVSVSISQGAIRISGVSGIIQSSGVYPVQYPEEMEIRAEPGPQAIWTATVSEVPVAANKLAFGQACMAPGTGIPATFSVTGDTTLSASVTNSSGQVVRDLGTFSVKEGNGSISWDGRGSTGGAVPTGSYTLNLLSSDPQGDQTSAQTGIYVDASGPSVLMTSPTAILPGQSASFQVTDPGCGVASAQITVVEEGGEEAAGASFGEYGPALPGNGAVSVSPETPWNPGRYKWTAKVASKAGYARTVTGSFRVVDSLPPKACVVPRVVGRTVAVAKKLLRAHGCLTGKIRHQASGKVSAGRVVRSRPKPHTHKQLHSRVVLVVAERPRAARK